MSAAIKLFNPAAEPVADPGPSLAVRRTAQTTADRLVGRVEELQRLLADPKTAPAVAEVIIAGLTEAAACLTNARLNQRLANLTGRD